GRTEVIAVSLGRCRWCKQVHRQQSILTWIIFLGVLFGIRFFDSVGISKQLVDAGFSVLGAMLVFKKICSDYFRILHSKWVGIKSATTEDISDHPEIFNRRYTNWHFGKSTV